MSGETPLLPARAEPMALTDPASGVRRRSVYSDAGARFRSMGSAGLKILGLAVFAFLLFGPLANLALWSVAERWYTPFKLPVSYGMRYWEVVFRPTGDAMASLATSVSVRP